MDGREGLRLHGNDPIHAVDPAGLSPVTDQQLAEYRNSNGLGGALHSAAGAVGHWFKNNWEYVAGAAMVVGGVALMATGVGGPAGLMLLSAGSDTLIQKYTTGTVNWGEVAIAGVAGGVGGGVGSAVARVAGEGLMGTVAVGMAGGLAEGAVNGGGNYLNGPGPHTVSGLVTHTADNAAIGGLTGGAGGAAAHGLSSLASAGGKVAGHGTDGLAGRTLDEVNPRPVVPEPVSDPATNKIYSARVLKRMADEPGPYHNFPESFDEQIYQGERKVVPDYFNKPKPLMSNDSVNYRLPGEINGQGGHYEIFTRPSESGRTEVVTHRFFRPSRG
jgi:hypothetical protein